MMDTGQDFFIHPSLCEEFSRAQYVDMLNDHDRNEKYRKTITKLINQSNLNDLILDIGTGTGLLSIMAAQSGAKNIVACEGTPYLARIAEKCVKDNHLTNIITIIPKRSTHLTVGPGSDLPEKATLLISEIVDSVLIEEYILPTMRHAVDNLLRPGAVVVPHRGTIYARVITCDHLWDFHSVNNNNTIGINLGRGDAAGRREEGEVGREKAEGKEEEGIGERVRKEGERGEEGGGGGSCAGTHAPFEVLVDEILPNHLTPITEPFVVFSFDFSNPVLTEVNQVRIRTTAPGKCHAIVTWWDLQLDREGDFHINTTPTLWRGGGSTETAEWRNHWKQCVFFMKEAFVVHEDQELTIFCFHDDHTLWFHLSPSLPLPPSSPPLSSSPSSLPPLLPLSLPLPLSPPHCTCGLHNLCRRPRLCMLNDTNRNLAYQTAIASALVSLRLESPGDRELSCLHLGDGSFLALVAGQLGAKVVSIENNYAWRDVASRLVLENGLEGRVVVTSKDALLDPSDGGPPFDVVVAEPWYFDAQKDVEWRNLLNFWREKCELGSFFSEKTRVIPAAATIHGMIVQFSNFQKQFQEVRISGIDNSVVNMVLSCTKPIISHPLWMYPFFPLSDPIEFFRFDFIRNDFSEMTFRDHITFTRDGTLHGVVLWVDYHLDGNTSVSTMPSWEEDRRPSWTRQGVWMFDEYTEVKGGGEVFVIAQFDPYENDLKFEFILEE